jgi:transposase
MEGGVRIREGARTPSPATVAAAAAAADKAAADELQRIQQQRERMREKGATGVARAGALRDLGTNAKAADCRELYAASKRNDNKAADACARQAALEAARDVIRRNADPEEVELALDLAQKALQRRKSGGPRDEDAMARLGALQCLREGLKSNDEHVQALAYRRLPNAAKALADGDDKVRRCAAHVVSDALGDVRAPGPKPPGANKLARTAARAAVNALADRFGDAAAVVACVDATGLWTPEVTAAVVAKRAAAKVVERRAVADALATAPAGDDVDEALAVLLEDADAGVRASAEYARMTQAAAAEDKLVRRRLRGDDDAQSSSTAPPPADKPPSRERWRGTGRGDTPPLAPEEVAHAAEFPDPPADDSDSDWGDSSDGEDAPPAAPDETLRRGAGGIGDAPEPELTAL